jgi:hypothetical protein
VRLKRRRLPAFSTTPGWPSFGMNPAVIRAGMSVGPPDALGTIS